jgi:hypothetical protein
MDLDLVFLDEIWFVLGVSPTSWVYSTVFYRCSLSPSRSSFFFFSFSTYRSFVRSFVRSFFHLRHSLLSSNIHYLLCHDHPFPSSIEIDASVFLESLFEDTFGAFAWSMVIDWSIFLEYISLMEFDDGVWIGLSFYGDLATTRMSSFSVIAAAAT